MYIIFQKTENKPKRRTLTYMLKGKDQCAVVAYLVCTFPFFLTKRLLERLRVKC